MQILVPTKITDSMLVSCTIPETDHPAWNSGTAYAIGDEVILASTHRRYRATAASTNKNPATNPTSWQDLGATNRWAMFDEKVGTVSSAVETFTVVLQPGLVSSFALIGLSCKEVRVVMTDVVDGVVYDRTFDLYDSTNVTDWWGYFFEPIQRSRTLVVSDLPIYGAASISVTLMGGAGEVVSTGTLLLGRWVVYDKAALMGASVGIQDYSRKETDDFGNWQITERAFSRRANWKFFMPNGMLDNLMRTLADLRAKPALYVGTTIYDSTVLYGFYRDFDVVIAYPTHSEVSIEIEGLT